MIVTVIFSQKLPKNILFRDYDQRIRRFFDCNWGEAAANHSEDIRGIHSGHNLVICIDRILKVHMIHVKGGLCQRDGEGVLYFTDHEDAVKAADAVQFAQSAEDQLLIVWHAAGVYLQHIVIVS